MKINKLLRVSVVGIFTTATLFTFTNCDNASASKDEVEETVEDENNEADSADSEEYIFEGFETGKDALASIKKVLEMEDYDLLAKYVRVPFVDNYAGIYGGDDYAFEEMSEAASMLRTIFNQKNVAKNFLISELSFIDFDEGGYGDASALDLDYYVVDTYNENSPTEDRAYVFIISKENGYYKLAGLEYEP